MRISKRLAIVATGVAVLGFLQGCGSTEDDNEGGNDESPSSSSLSPEVAQTVEAGYEGTHREPPADGPAAQTGKDIWVISCGQAFPGCSLVTDGILQASEELGWNTELVDGKGDPLLFNQGLRQAIAAKPDGIMLVAIDCNLVQAPLEEAKEAGIPVVAPYAFDCSDPLIGGEALFAADVNYGTESIGQYFEDWGALQANYVAATSDGKAKIVELNDPGYLFAQYRQKGFDAEIERVCPDCEILDRVDAPVADLASGAAAQKAQTLLAQHPEADVLVTAYDAQLQVIATSMATAVERGVRLVGDEGFPPNIELIKQGIQDSAVAMPVEYIGWAGADTMNRVLAGETDIPDAGTGYTIIDKDHNLPSGDKWEPDVDFRTAYMDVWSGEGS